MNSGQPSREQIETRITAMLLGEVSSEEAALLRYAMAQDPALQQLHDELRATLILMREAAKHPAESPVEKNALLTLSTERRQKLFTHFKTPRARPSFWLSPIVNSSLAPYLVAFALIAVLAAILLPVLSASKSHSLRGTYGTDGSPGLAWKIPQSQNKPDRATLASQTAPPPAASANRERLMYAKSTGTTTITPAAQPPPPAPIVLPQLAPAPDTAEQAGVAVVKEKEGDFSRRLAESGKAQNASGSPAPQASTPVTPAPVEVAPPTANSAHEPVAVFADSTAKVPAEALDSFVPSSRPIGQAGGGFGGFAGFGGGGGAVGSIHGPKADEQNAAAPPGVPALVARRQDQAQHNLSAAAPTAASASVAPATPGGGVGFDTVSGVVLSPNGLNSDKPAINLAGKFPAETPASAGIITQQIEPSWVGALDKPAPNSTPPENRFVSRFASAAPTSGVSLGVPPNQQLAAESSESRDAGVVGGLAKKSAPAVVAGEEDLPIRKPVSSASAPQPEILTRENAFATFALNVSDVSFKFAEASLQNGKLPDAASIRSEEFINAFDYRDHEAVEGQAVAFTSELARYPFEHNRELLRFAVKAAAAGRQEGRSLNLVLLLDNSGSMERADRVAIIRQSLRVLATQLQPRDVLSVVTFARTARLWADGISGDKAGETLDRVGGITPEGGTNLEEAMRLAYETARRHYLRNGMNRVVLLTDGAANLGDVDPNSLKHTVEAQRKQGIALDCFGIGWEDFNDNLLEQLSSAGDGRYAFLNSPEDASRDFAAKLAGALQIAAADVKVQVEFNPGRVISYRQIGYATHQLAKEQFRDNSVAAGQIAAQEAGNALFTVETNPNGNGPVATVHVRYRVPGTSDYHEHEWVVAYSGGAPALENSSAAMRLAAAASAFSEWLAASPYAQEVSLDKLLQYLNGVPEVYGADDRPKQLETMIREAKSLDGK